MQVRYHDKAGKEIRIGSRVMCIEDSVCLHRPVEGKCGTVMIFDKGTVNPVGVVFDSDVGGHSLRCSCQDGHGWFVSYDDLRVIEEDDDDTVFETSSYADMISMMTQ